MYYSRPYITLGVLFQILTHEMPGGKNTYLVVRGAKGVMMALRLKEFNYTETKWHINMDTENSCNFQYIPVECDGQQGKDRGRHLKENFVSRSNQISHFS